MVETPAIRRLSVDDADIWRAIRLEALQSAPEAFGQTYAHAVAQPLESFAKTVGSPNPLMAAFAGDRAIATAGIYTIDGPKSAHRGMLWGMYVAPQYRGKQVGEKLVEAAIAAVAPDIRQVHLRVVTENVVAYKLYRRLGFVAYGIEPRALSYNGRYYDETMMVRML
ncbi:MAG: N-acetyltransferase family protein [Hyphomicrobiaceae bacterium]